MDARFRDRFEGSQLISISVPFLTTSIFVLNIYLFQMINWFGIVRLFEFVDKGGISNTCKGAHEESPQGNNGGYGRREQGCSRCSERALHI